MVKVPWPTNSSYDQLTPSHVTVKRCSGGCHGGSASCVATATSKRKVRTLLTKILTSLETLLQVAVLLARCPLGGGACDKECATVEVEDEVGEHTVLINTIETGQQHTAEPLVSCDDEIRSEEGDGLDGRNDAPSVNVGSPTSSTSSRSVPPKQLNSAKLYFYFSKS